MAMKHRLKRLERKAAPAVQYPKCPACGDSDNPNHPRKFVCTTREPGAPDTPQPEDFCATCGRQHTFHVKFDKCG